MAPRLGRFSFLAIAVVFHLIYSCSIFDIYFVSPIVHGMQSFGNFQSGREEAPAQRLVLFVGDGLRADKAFQSFPDPSPSIVAADHLDAAALTVPRPLAPFLRSKVLNEGTFGVSHTRVPTESRPGHVALIAGLYEDVSAVMTGWKLNPVNFDSVFNRSRHTWSWGSPDILPMFKEGAVPGRVDADCYGEEHEDFTKDATQLDTWVFERVKDLFAGANNNETLNAQLRQDKNVFFLHLLGLDTTGHAYRPYSREYLHNIKVVDEGVREITTLIDEFYDDGKTAFVFTADHGMSDMGSHGDGHPDNTRTPLIAWGSGVAPPHISSSQKAPGHEDGFSSDWGLDHVQRNDVAQADIAALMAHLAGLDYPVNSVGKLPLQYLSDSPEAKATAAMINTRALLEMFRVKEEQKRANEFRFKAFSPFDGNNKSVDQRLADVEDLIRQGLYTEAITSSHQLFDIGLQGLRYLQTYDWLFLRVLITTGYLGWMAYALTTVLDMHVLRQEMTTSRSWTSSAIFFGAGTLLFTNLYFRNASLYYYAYSIFPLFFWEEVNARKKAFVSAAKILFRSCQDRQSILSPVLMSISYIAVLEALVFSYFHRTVYTVCFIALIFWPLIYGQDFIRQDKTLICSWALACLSMSVFTLLSATKVENSTLILIGGILMIIIGMAYLIFQQRILTARTSNASVEKLDSASRSIIGIQIGLIALAVLVTKSSISFLQARLGLPLGNQVVGWIVLVAPLLVPFLHSFYPNKHYLHRLVIIFLTFSPIFVILTISYEGIFYLAFCLTLVMWVRLEHHLYMYSKTNQPLPAVVAIVKTKSPSAAATDIANQLSSPTESAKYPDKSPYRALTLSDARISLFFLFLLQSAFFSTGNVASISSFSLDAVYRLIPVFNPFSQGILLLLKILIPFAVISANLGILNRRLNVAPSSIFMVVMAISDVMTLNFFWLVRDEGSWLEIGSSISHFIIVNMFCIFVPALELVAEIFVSGVDVSIEMTGANLMGEISHDESGKDPGQNGIPKTKTSLENA